MTPRNARCTIGTGVPFSRPGRGADHAIRGSIREPAVSRSLTSVSCLADAAPRDLPTSFASSVVGKHKDADARADAGGDLHHEIEIPFRTAITGGEVALHVRRPTGKTEAIAVKIPAGIEDGRKIRLREQGESAPDRGKSGDLLITVRVQPHPHYHRRGTDLEVIVPVTLAEAALGAKVDIPTPKGVITLTVPPGSSGGRRLRVKGHGIAAGKDPAGDLFAELRIVLPKKIDEESAAQIRALDQRYPLNPRVDLQW